MLSLLRAMMLMATGMLSRWIGRDDVARVHARFPMLGCIGSITAATSRNGTGRTRRCRSYWRQPLDIGRRNLVIRQVVTV